MAKKIISLFLVLVMLGSLATPVMSKKAEGYDGKCEYYAGRKVRVNVEKDGYSFIDLKTEKAILMINFTAINENLGGKPVISKNDAFDIASDFCGENYSLVRITENPHDFDILFERQIDGIAVFGEDCYVVINKMTGKIAAFRKMPINSGLSDKIKAPVKMNEESFLRLVNSNNAKMYFSPTLGAFLLTDMGAMSAENGKILNEEIKKLIEENYKTTINFKNLEKLRSNYQSLDVKGVNNDQGAVFRADDSWLIDNVDAAKLSMEKIWDPKVDDYGTITQIVVANNIFKNFEAVFYSGHGSKEGNGYGFGECILLSGTGKNPGQWYCYHDVGYNLQTRLIVIQACYAAKKDNSKAIANILVSRGVNCVIGASGSISDYDSLGIPTCKAWADIFWDYVTGNSDVNYQKRTAHEARIEANNFAFLWFCDLDSEIGNCNIYV